MLSPSWPVSSTASFVIGWVCATTTTRPPIDWLELNYVCSNLVQLRWGGAEWSEKTNQTIPSLSRNNHSLTIVCYSSNLCLRDHLKLRMDRARIVFSRISSPSNVCVCVFSKRHSKIWKLCTCIMSCQPFSSFELQASSFKLIAYSL